MITAKGSQTTAKWFMLLSLRFFVRVTGGVVEHSKDGVSATGFRGVDPERVLVPDDQ